MLNPEPALTITNRAFTSAALRVMPEKATETVRPMTRGTISRHAIITRTKPTLIVDKAAGRDMIGEGVREERRLRVMVELNDIRLKITQHPVDCVGDLAGISRVGPGIRSTRNLTRAGVKVSQRDGVTSLLQPFTAFHDHAVDTAPVGAGGFVGQKDAHTSVSDQKFLGVNLTPHSEQNLDSDRLIWPQVEQVSRASASRR
jgi:hypothetical protein